MPDVKIIEFPTLDSTNNYLKRTAAALPHLTCAVAETQTGGKGRMGRSFFSPTGGLYFSVLLKSLPLSSAQLLTPMAAVAVCEALEACGSERAGIKWVNDVYVRERKVCGILTETRIEHGKLDYAVIGIGINLAKPDSGFPKDIENRAGAVFESCDTELRKKILDEVLQRIAPGAEHAAEKSFLESYRQRSILIDREVTVIQGDISYPARVRGIDDDCRLIAESDGRTIALNTGEVSIKFE